MVGVLSLWLPILLSAVAVFLVSSIAHMATKWHQDDFRKLPDEAAVAAALRPLAIPPGDYLLPCPGDSKEMASPAFQEKLVKGPVAMLTVLPNGPTPMGSNLAWWFVYTLVVGAVAGYLAGAALGPGAPYLSVFRFVGTTAFSGYSLALWQATIWFRKSIGTTIRGTIDGLIYALVTAGIFGWLWP
ncbi:MAG: hypothetical protein ACKVZ0_19415 [Gemmatimonadales bacterium]